MSKSYGNAIGIKEAPLEMYGKLMSISDAMMWRYYELLTDVQIADIEQMKRDAHPMQAKKDLAARIVKDFHSSEAAAKAADDWAKQFQKDEVPENVEEISLPAAEFLLPDKQGAAIRLDKLLKATGLAESVSDGARKLKQNSVHVNGETRTEPTMFFPAAPRELMVKVGRKIKRVTFN